jgi:cystathionine beta-lyase family protein involved in aluminum resistance
MHKAFKAIADLTHTILNSFLRNFNDFQTTMEILKCKSKGGIKKCSLKLSFELRTRAIFIRKTTIYGQMPSCTRHSLEIRITFAICARALS